MTEITPYFPAYLVTLFISLSAQLKVEKCSLALMGTVSARISTSFQRCNVNI